MLLKAPPSTKMEERVAGTDEGNPLETSTDMDDDFEFIRITGDHNDGQIPPVFPLFNRDLLTDPDQSDGKKLNPGLALRLPQDKSFAIQSEDKERDPPSSPSSESEADELRSAPADDYYCLRKPEEQPCYSQRSLQGSAQEKEGIRLGARYGGSLGTLSSHIPYHSLPQSLQSFLPISNAVEKLQRTHERLPLDRSFAFESGDKERDPPSSPSSDQSEADADDYFCLRKPEDQAVEKPPRTYKKSDSAGALASKEWKLSDFLHRRSSSQGTEDSFVLCSVKDRGLEGEIKETIGTDQKAGKTSAIKAGLISAHEVFYARKQGEKKRKSYVPYRQDLAGFFFNVNAYGKAFSRFKSIGGHAP